jgi:acyl-CoA synthetase (AMP-forming)/AMP-acid ligase II
LNVSEMLKRNGRMFPQEIALIEREPNKDLRKHITWRQFDERVDKIANGLIDHGVGKGDRVIQWMMNSINWLEAYLGILRTGAWAVPLNYRFTLREFEYCRHIAEPKAIIFDEQFVDRIESTIKPSSQMGHDLYVVVGEKAPPGMERFEDFVEESSSTAVETNISDDDPAALYFTSGTTGDPKPILLSHKNLECVAITQVVHGLRKPGDVFVIFRPLYHAGEKMQWLASLILGGRAVIRKGKITPQVILETIRGERVTVAVLPVPWLLDILTALDRSEIRKEEYDLSCWRLVLYGAQPVPPHLVRRFEEKFPHIEYEVNYGLTEASGAGCVHLGIGNGHKLGSIGRPGFNWEVRIIDEKGEDVEIGEVGEIIVKGNGVMKGYYKNPEKTSETIKNGWLYTGDMGKMDREGFIWLVDRKKDVILRGGENIYPSEIEEILYGHPKIHDVAVMGLPDERLGERVAAVIELRQEVPASIETEREIIEFCEENLSRYKRPQKIIFDEVLRNLTGKIEKAKMRQKYLEGEEEGNQR